MRCIRVHTRAHTHTHTHARTHTHTHVMLRRVTEGLVTGAGALLAPGGFLFIYGPFKQGGAFTSESNRAFHESLVSQDPEWGYRDVADIEAVAITAGLQPAAMGGGIAIAMPANNCLLVFRRPLDSGGNSSSKEEKPA
jgi:Protein of unknown function (DUF938)